jgi:UDPglucose 6-dehydrogenase
MVAPIIGFAGLTHLGINSQAAAAAHGFSTVGFHPDSALTEQLSRKILPITEPGLPELFKAHAAHLRFGAEPSILEDCDLVYVSVDVPTDDRGQSDLSSIHEMIGTVSPVMKPDSLLVVLCQVPPGFTRQLPLPSDRLYYQVETLIFGRAVERALHPERIIVGCFDPKTPLPTPLNTYLSAFGCPVLPMRYESAELTKISINMCLVASVSVANTMAELCENVAADWNEVVPALKLDKRIGPYAYLKPGLGIAGGNLERDLATVVKLADQAGSNAQIVQKYITDSAYRKDWVLRKLRKTILRADARVNLGVLGLAYKENTASIKNSASIELLTNLTCRGQTHGITVYDPEVRLSDTPITSVSEADNALAACCGAQVVLVMTPWPEFKKLSLSDIATAMEDSKEAKWLIDPFRVFEPVDCEGVGLRQVILGCPTS